MRSFLFMYLKNRTKMENIKKIKEALELARSLIDMADTEEWAEIDNAIKICTEAIKKNAVLPLVSGSDSKECKNCLYFNVAKTECKHPNWDKCIKRDDDEYVIDYVYHEYHYR